MELNLDWRREASALWPEVTFEIRPLKVWAFQELLAHWEAGGAGVNQAIDPGGDEKPEKNQAVPSAAGAGVGLIEVAKHIFPEHVRELRGITLTRNGATANASLEALCEETALLKLALEIVSKLMAISEIASGEEKN